MRTDTESGSPYPEPHKGPLSSDNSDYAVYVKPKGPKMGDVQRKTTLFGVVFFIIFTISMAVYFGIAGYL